MILCEQFVNSGLALAHTDEKLSHYTDIMKAMDAIERHQDIGPIRVNLQRLISTIRAFAIDWKDTLSKFLIEKTNKCLASLHRHLMVASMNNLYTILILDDPTQKKNVP